MNKRFSAGIVCVAMGCMLLFAQTALADSSSSSTADMPQDGTYTIETSLEGGSGRAGVESPSRLVVKDGQVTIDLVWDSGNYDKMTVAGVDYLPTNKNGNSSFSFPIQKIGDVAVSAETTAMSTPHMIDYTLHMDASTLKATTNAGQDQNPMDWLFIALGVILVGLAIVIGNNYRK
jgi:iron complex transport system substrate-binding protein